MTTEAPPQMTEPPAFELKDYRQPLVTSLGVILGFLIGFLAQWVSEDDFALSGAADWLVFAGCWQRRPTTSTRLRGLRTRLERFRRKRRQRWMRCGVRLIVWMPYLLMLRTHGRDSARDQGSLDGRPGSLPGRGWPSQ